MWHQGDPQEDTMDSPELRPTIRFGSVLLDIFRPTRARCNGLWSKFLTSAGPERTCPVFLFLLVAFKNSWSNTSRPQRCHPMAIGRRRRTTGAMPRASMPRTSLQVLDEQMAMETLRRIRPKSQAAPCRSYAACVGVSSFSRRLAGGIGTEISGDLGRK